MKIVKLRRGWVPVLTACCVLVAACQTGRAARLQDDERRLWDTEFLKKRQPAKTSNPAMRRPSAYRRATPKPPAADDRVPGEMVGVTVWRLRQSSSSDNKDSRLLLQEDDKDATIEWTPERVEADTEFKVGDRVRLSIESSRNGYLYVIDREKYADGTTSDPYLIFPTLRVRGGDNRVAAGKVIELPERNAFKLQPMRPDYKGEQLTLLITDQPLAEVRVPPRIAPLDKTLVDQWESKWAGATERFEMIGGAGKVYTKTEKDAGTEGRLLTQEDELPQTLYRIVPKAGEPLLITVPVRIGK